MEENVYLKKFIIIAVLIVNSGNAQQTINLNIKHDWEISRYTTNADNTVTDTKTNLIWKKCSEGSSDNNCTTGSDVTYTWQEALNLSNNSNDTWRLPNIKELRSLVAYDRHNPAINTSIFPNTPSEFFWSSSPYTSDDRFVSILTFFYGSDNIGGRRAGEHHVRLVRDR